MIFHDRRPNRSRLLIQFRRNARHTLGEHGACRKTLARGIRDRLSSCEVQKDNSFFESKSHGEVERAAQTVHDLATQEEDIKHTSGSHVESDTPILTMFTEHAATLGIPKRQDGITPFHRRGWYPSALEKPSSGRKRSQSKLACSSK